MFCRTRDITENFCRGALLSVHNATPLLNQAFQLEDQISQGPHTGPIGIILIGDVDEVITFAKIVDTFAAHLHPK